MGYFVHAHYDKEMDERRETRIRAAITRCDAWGRTGSRVDWEGEGDDPSKQGRQSWKFMSMNRNGRSALRPSFAAAEWPSQ